MPFYKKSILKVGKYHSPDGIVNVTPKRLKHWAEMHRSLLDAGQVVPVEWDHADDPTQAIPLSAEEYKKKRSAKNTVGHLKDFKVAEDGKSAEIVMNILRKSAKESAESNAVFVSPVIFGQWRDGAGNDYKDVITHMDFVNHPVDNSQGPFQKCEPGTIACALRMGLDVGHPVVFRMADDVEDDTNGKKKRYLDDDKDDEGEKIVEMGEEDDDMLDDDEYKKKKKKSSDDMDMEDMDYEDDDYDIDEMGDDDDDEMGDDDDDMEEDLGINDGDPEEQALAAKISEDLEAAGISPPEGVDPISDPKDFLRQLCAALRQKAMDERDDKLDEAQGENNEPNDLGDEEMMTTSPEFAALSLTSKVTHQWAQRQLRDKLNERVSLCLSAGKVQPKMAGLLRKAFKNTVLRLSRNGNQEKGEAERRLEVYESLPDGAYWPGDQSVLQLAMSTQPSEETLTGATGKEDAKKYVDEQKERNPGMFVG